MHDKANPGVAALLDIRQMIGARSEPQDSIPEGSGAGVGDGEVLLQLPSAAKQYKDKKYPVSVGDRMTIGFVSVTGNITPQERLTHILMDHDLHPTRRAPGEQPRGNGHAVGGLTEALVAQGQGGDYLIPGVDSPLWQTLNVSETMRRSRPALC